MKFNVDCFGSGLLGAFGLAAIGGMLFLGCSEAHKEGFREGERAGRTAAEKELRAKAMDPGSYPKGSCVQQAVQCDAKGGEPRLDFRRDTDGHVVAGRVFVCEKSDIQP